MMTTRGLYSLTLKSASVICGALIQILQFKNLDARDYIFIAIITLICAIIGQIDFGIVSNFSIKRLKDSKKKGLSLQEIHFITESYKVFKPKLNSLFTLWSILSIVTITSLLIKLNRLNPDYLVLATITVMVIILNAISGIVSRLLITLDQSNHVLSNQLIALISQIIIFLVFPNLVTAILGLLVGPLVLLFFVSISTKNLVKIDKVEINIKNQKKETNWTLQLNQILGVLITLFMPFMAVFSISKEAAAVFQIQYKIALVVIGVVSSTYMSILRYSILLPKEKINLMTLQSTILSLLITAATIIFLENFWITFFADTKFPSLGSWIPLVVYIVLQPLTQIKYFQVLVQEKYRVLITSSILQMCTLTMSFLILSTYEYEDLVVFALPFSTLISFIPVWCGSRHRL